MGVGLRLMDTRAGSPALVAPPTSGDPHGDEAAWGQTYLENMQLTKSSRPRMPAGTWARHDDAFPCRPRRLPDWHVAAVRARTRRRDVGNR